MFEFCGRPKATSIASEDTYGSVNNVDIGESTMLESPRQVSGALAARGRRSGNNVEIS